MGNQKGQNLLIQDTKIPLCEFMWNMGSHVGQNPPGHFSDLFKTTPLNQQLRYCAGEITANASSTLSPFPSLCCMLVPELNLVPLIVQVPNTMMLIKS